MQDALAGRAPAIVRFLARMQCVPRMLHAQNARFGRPFTPEELADVIQETLLAVWRKLSGYNGLARLETWVYRFCYLEYMRRLRAKRRQRSSSRNRSRARRSSPR